MEELYCKYCKKVQKIYTSEQVFSNGTTHIRADCEACGRYLQYMPQYLPLEEEVIPFGAYKGEKLVNLKTDYLQFLYASGQIKNNIKTKIQKVLELKK
jgi:uncharacterized protein (DUF3820 family)